MASILLAKDEERGVEGEDVGDKMAWRLVAAGARGGAGGGGDEKMEAPREREHRPSSTLRSQPYRENTHRSMLYVGRGILVPTIDLPDTNIAICSMASI